MDERERGCDTFEKLYIAWWAEYWENVVEWQGDEAGSVLFMKFMLFEHLAKILS